MTSGDFREAFLRFFEERGHEIVKSSPVVPHDDPTLLFTNAGMNQFKNYLLGIEPSPYRRAASVQKCIRASGKHNDLEDVGKDGRHHTFFEMLGNWSFGDYYKKEAAEWSWEFVCAVMGLSEDRLWVSVYKDDEEAYDIWLNTIGVDKKRIVKLGDIEKGDMENFWSMGDTGPCGPCSEIHYGYFPQKDEDFVRASEEGQIIELWNLVFMEFNRSQDGSLTPLPAKNIDTGMGLERALAILQHAHSNYETDLFSPLFKKMEELSGVSARADGYLVSMQVIVDHIRSLAFAIADGAVPSNEGRGYVLRRILRRAVRHGKLLGLDRPFLHLLVDSLTEEMGGAYPELEMRKAAIQSIVRNEEEMFFRTLDRGLDEFAKTVERLKKEGKRVFPGEEAFVLHDTYGFPLDLTRIMAEEEHMSLDTEGFENRMDLQRKRAKESSKFRGDYERGDWEFFRNETTTVFTGYDVTTQADMRLVKYRRSDSELFLVFDRTPFYGEAGGQVGDTGWIEGDGTRIRIKDVTRSGEIFIHLGETEAGEIRDVEYTGYVDVARRKKIMANHTATHLLHYALRRIFGPHVTQAGSLVAPDRLRFDFTHYKALTDGQIAEIEKIVNVAVLQNLPVRTHLDVPIDEAMNMGAMALFGEKYGENVRVVQVDELSTELCGGTHTERTGDIGLFKIVRESSISSGVRRVEATTHISSLEMIEKNESVLKALSETLGVPFEEIPEKVNALRQRISELEKQLKKGKKQKFEELFDYEKDVCRAGKFNLVLLRLPDHSLDELREISDRIKSKVSNAVVFLASSEGNRAVYVLAATEDAMKNGIHSGNLLKDVLKEFGGRGGGRSHLAQGGGTAADKIDAVFTRARDLVSRLQGHGEN
jgi:alanyl-tRNA synthetase